MPIEHRLPLNYPLLVFFVSKYFSEKLVALIFLGLSSSIWGLYVIREICCHISYRLLISRFLGINKAKTTQYLPNIARNGEFGLRF